MVDRAQDHTELDLKRLSNKNIIAAVPVVGSGLQHFQKKTVLLRRRFLHELRELFHEGFSDTGADFVCKVPRFQHGGFRHGRFCCCGRPGWLCGSAGVFVGCHGWFLLCLIFNAHRCA